MRKVHGDKYDETDGGVVADKQTVILYNIIKNICLNYIKIIFPLEIFFQIVYVLYQRQVHRAGL